MKNHNAHVRLLGEFALDTGGAQVPLTFNAQRLVAFLALDPQERSQDYVAGRLWPDSGRNESLARLRDAIEETRRVDPAVISESADSVRLSNRVSVDLHGLLDQIRILVNPAVPYPEENIDQATLTKELLPSWLWDDWVLVGRERLRQLCSYALEALCERLLRAGRSREAVEAGRAAVRSEPLREGAQRALISALLARGDREEALRQYRDYRALLFRDLGLKPSPELARLAQAHQLE